MSDRKHRYRISGALIALALAAVACGNDDGDSGTGDGGATATGDGGATALTGDIVVSGSSTVQPISALVAELFAEDNPDVSVSVDGPGTGDGFELFCNGETDISDASRAIKEEEQALCEENGINFVELEVALDGITVMTNPQNEAVTCMNTGDLYALIGPESEGFANWSDANDLGTEVGGAAVPYPDAPLDIVAPGEESGTYDAFIELALADIIEEREAEEATRPDYQSSPNDNVIIQGIEGSPSSLGWVGFAFAEEAAEGVKIVEIDGGDGCVAPSRETIADGSYPLSRSLYIYVNTDKAAENPALKGYVDFYMTDAGLNEAVAESGYVDLPSERIAATQAAWEDAAA
ncbi:MAG: phosphate ABC transporter substrate-binding protein PstS family protein [Actinobacteria bacterium]|nr:phosphate ABC transporter substrate-binding protein PstS family protein [Actinomycetota bacterium]